jgi:hypothetical protein
MGARRAPNYSLTPTTRTHHFETWIALECSKNKAYTAAEPLVCRVALMAGWIIGSLN